MGVTEVIWCHTLCTLPRPFQRKKMKRLKGRRKGTQKHGEFAIGSEVETVHSQSLELQMELVSFLLCCLFQGTRDHTPGGVPGMVTRPTEEGTLGTSPLYFIYPVFLHH